jgi:hypothetical protein
MGQNRKDEEIQFPQTFDAAVQLILSRMSDSMKLWLRQFDGDEIELQVRLAAGVTPGMSVRTMLGLCGEKPELLRQLPLRYQHPDEASIYFLIECRRRLQATHKEERV